MIPLDDAAMVEMISAICRRKGSCSARDLSEALGLDISEVKDFAQHLIAAGCLYPIRDQLLLVPVALRHSYMARHAQRVLHRAVRAGVVIKPSACHRCRGQVGKAALQGHHADYAKPLDVEWLCSRCHCGVPGLARGCTPRVRRRMPVGPRTVAGPLSDTQRVVLSEIARYYMATGEPCSVSYLARKLGRSRTAVQGHVDALYRKGCLSAPAAPRTTPLPPGAVR